MARFAIAHSAAVLLALQTGFAWAGGAAGVDRAPSGLHAAPDRTVKERLSSKASDEQRVDNCKVPIDVRGPKPRPDNCRQGAGTAPKE